MLTNNIEAMFTLITPDEFNKYSIKRLINK